jgi:putative Mg2+ transporter-C (MgtC) family protein
MISFSVLALLQTPWPDVLNLGLLGRLVIAAVLGGVIGLEREISGKPAGLRTNLLICVGAALLMELSIGVAALANVENVAFGTPFRADPGRIAAQIVSGIGFLGAGTIIQARGNVMGLTTAATIWVVAAIGMAVGARAYVESVGATVLVLISLAVLSRVEFLVTTRWGNRRYIVRMDPDPAVWEEVESAFRTGGLRVRLGSIEKAADHYEAAFDVTGPSATHEAVVRRLVTAAHIHRITSAI